MCKALKSTALWIRFCIPIFIFTAVATLYYISGYVSPTPFDLFIQLADRIIHGKLWFDHDVRHYDFAQVGNKYYVVQPPFPALLLTPIVAIFGTGIPQNIVSIMLGGCVSAVVYGIVRRQNFPYIISIGISFLFAFGTLMWYVCVVGSTWYFAHVVAVLFMLLAIYEGLGKGRGIVVGLLWGAAFFTRLPTLLGVPFIAALTWYAHTIKQDRFRQLILLGLGFGLFFFTDIAYNFYRYDTPFDISHQYWYEREVAARGVYTIQEFEHGPFSLRYIPRHLKVMFLKLPPKIKDFPYYKPSQIGMALWAVMPFLIFSLWAPLRDWRVRTAWICVAAIALATMRFAGIGQSQFGYRFALDYLPILFFLFLLGIRGKPRIWHYIFAILSIIINAWGVIGIQRLGWGTWN